jgi:hypothetical protein
MQASFKDTYWNETNNTRETATAPGHSRDTLREIRVALKMGPHLNDELLTLAGGRGTKNLELMCTLCGRVVFEILRDADLMLNESQKKR